MKSGKDWCKSESFHLLLVLLCLSTLHPALSPILADKGMNKNILDILLFLATLFLLQKITQNKIFTRSAIALGALAIFLRAFLLPERYAFFITICWLAFFVVAMAVTIMAGLTFASILTLIVVPVLYAIFFRVPSSPQKLADFEKYK